MSTGTSVQRSSFVADFELYVEGRTLRPAAVAETFIVLDKMEPVQPGPAELVIRINGGPENRRQIEVLGPDPEHPDRLLIRR